MLDGMDKGLEATFRRKPADLEDPEADKMNEDQLDLESLQRKARMVRTLLNYEAIAFVHHFSFTLPEWHPSRRLGDTFGSKAQLFGKICQGKNAIHSPATIVLPLTAEQLKQLHGDVADGIPVSTEMVENSPEGDEDVDGEPLDEDEDVDGVPLSVPISSILAATEGAAEDEGMCVFACE